MSHIYIHIPFCRSACNYCNFHFAASKKYRKPFVDALIKEIELTKQYLPKGSTYKDQIRTIYFGGGTPSVLPVTDILNVVDAIASVYKLKHDIEFTIEANPDDITKEYAGQLFQIGVNRVSLGVQSFNEKDLKYLNRKHAPVAAVKAVRTLQDAGLSNINIDLIYGIPGSSERDWMYNLNTFADLNIPHLSAYSLTLEEKTTLAYLINKGLAKQPDENEAIIQYNMLTSFMDGHNYKHYEISNFAKEGFFSNHNTAYWKDKPYLGLGPSAHSYNLISRQWNVSNTTKYIKQINAGIVPAEIEELSNVQKYNEYVFTRLRTSWGVNHREMAGKYGKAFSVFFRTAINKYVSRGQVYQDNSCFKLTGEGMLYADAIASDCFYTQKTDER